ncbi:MAG: hypothetical protein WAN86_05920 [Hyphomicrobiaceae bacterium]
MRAFSLACLAAIVLGVGAALVLNSGFLPNAVSSVFTTESVRI